MDLAEIETAALALSEEERKVLAQKIWNSIVPASEEIDAWIQVCDQREREADQAEDGWTPAEDFLAEMRDRKR